MHPRVHTGLHQKYEVLSEIYLAVSFPSEKPSCVTERLWVVLALFRSNKKNPQTSNFKVISTSDNADTMSFTYVRYS